jgi:hypothetical protein
MRLVDTDPSLCLEGNAFHLTPIHLAVTWPDGLRALLNRSGLPPVDPGFESPLSISTRYASEICKGRDSVLCSNCSCFESAEIILRHDCSLWDSDLRILLREASFKTKVILIKHVKEHRIRQRDFALGSLSIEDCHSLGLHSMSIPDASAHQVIQLLHRGGWKVPDPLQIRTNKGTKNSSDWGSFYHYIKCPATADIVLSLGFEDLDSENSRGNTPLSQARSPQYAIWLIEYGADIAASSTHIVGSKFNQSTVHGVAEDFGSYLSDYLDQASIRHRHQPELDPECRNRLFHLICNTDAPDNCECACSSQEYNPFLAILKAAMRRISRERFNSDGVSVPKIIRFSSQLYRTFPKDIAEDPVISLAVLRYLTFSLLGIRHTCSYCYCEPRRPRVGEPYDEEEQSGQ